MEKIIEFIIKDIQSVDKNVWYILAGVILLLIIVVIVKLRQTPKITYYDEVQEYNDIGSEYSSTHIPSDSEEQRAERNAWIFIDTLSLVVLCCVAYVIELYKFFDFIRKPFDYVVSYLAVILLYYGSMRRGMAKKTWKDR